MKRKQIVVARLIALIALLAMGFLSNWLAASGCEHDAARKLTSGFQDSNTAYFPNWKLDVDPASLFSSNTIVFRTNRPKRDASGARTHATPFGVGKAETWIPFVVRVDWGWSTDSVTGAEGASWYLCLGKFRLELRRYVTAYI